MWIYLGIIHLRKIWLIQIFPRTKNCIMRGPGVEKKVVMSQKELIMGKITFLTWPYGTIGPLIFLNFYRRCF